MRSVAFAAMVRVSLVVAALAACGGDGTVSEFGKTCRDNSECSSGFCLADLPHLTSMNTTRGCTQSCTVDTDCPDVTRYACGISPTGDRVCVQRCEQSIYDDYVCDNGVSTSCAQASDALCDACGCDAGAKCEPGVGCIPLAGVGDPCEEDHECLSKNCSYFANVCRVAVGAPCSGTTCDSCWVSGSTSFCSRICRTASECGSDLCVGFYLPFDCVPRCDTSCDTACETTSSGSRYCPRSSFTSTDAARATGEICLFHESCASGECITGQDRCDGETSPRICNGERGYCTNTCSGDVDCENGTRCVDIPCVFGETTTCGQRCLPSCGGSTGATCSLGVCRSEPLVDGGEAEVCALKLADGQRCSVYGDCVSGSCVSAQCAPELAGSNGTACSVPNDCTSNSCIDNVCRGSVRLDASCDVPADCIEGTCCRTGTCKETCPF